MAGASDLLKRIQATLAAYDDDALAALANKGLLRRARKDLESAPPAPPVEEGDHLVFQMDEAVVRIPERIPDARCTCPAGTICRHILAALIALKRPEPAEAEECGARNEECGIAEPDNRNPESDKHLTHPSAFRMPHSLDEAAAITDADLVKWAGRPLFNKACKTLAEGVQCEIKDGAPALFFFPLWNETVRWVPGAGLDGTLCTCHAPAPCLHRVAAVLALGARRGARPSELESQAATLAAAQGAPRTRAEVMESAATLLREAIVLGLSRLAPATGQRLRTLATSTHGVQLPRLAAMLRALANEAADLLRRDAQSDTRRILYRAARVEALRTALEHPTPGMVGQHRTQYFPCGGTLDLIGLGARRWRSRSGYAGLTLYFWDPAARAWLSWSEARPAETAGFNPQARYRAAGPWSGAPSPSAASRGQIQLTGAWRSQAGRLSGRESTRAFLSGPADPAAVPAVTDWRELIELAASLFGGGLGDWQELQDLVILAPAAWGERRYDPIRQALDWPVRDEAGARIDLTLDNRKENTMAIHLLERAEPDQGTRLLGQLQFRDGRLCIEPIALYQDGQILNLTLDAPQSIKSKTPIRPINPKSPIVPMESEAGADEAEPDESEDAGEYPATGSSSPLGLLLAAAQSELEAIAEAGLAAPHPLEPLRAALDRMEALGLTACAGPGHDFISAMEALRRDMEYDRRLAARALLRWSYVLRLAAAQIAIQEAAVRLNAEDE